ncbi:MAG: hypothetical protein ILP17_02155 [Lachnospiraceae bacterium]|nr:hypothetical protein [Lachnospiraceae bacterium]
MNKRLYKLESNEIRKMMLLFTSLVAVYMLLSIICTAVSNNTTTDAAFIMKTIFVFIGALLIILTAIAMIKRLYNLLFTGEGLVRISFPVKNHEHLNSNLKHAAAWLGIMLIIFFTGLGISDAVVKNRVERWGVGNLYSDLADNYTMNGLSSPAAKTVLTIVILIIAFAVIAANIYLSFVLTLTLSSRICGKYNILQKKGVIFITGIVMYNVHLLIMELFSRIEYSYSEWLAFGRGYDLFGPDCTLLSAIDRPVMNILIYGVTAVLMYRISANILDKKLDI